MSAETDTAVSAEIPATPEAQAELMFELARNIVADPACEIRPEGIALIACATGIIGQAVARLEGAQARADLAYAEGARQRDEATRCARAQVSSSGFLTLDLTDRDWVVVEEGQELLLDLDTQDERIAVATLLSAAQKFGRRIRISIEPMGDET